MLFSCEEPPEEWRWAVINYPASAPVPPGGTVRTSFNIDEEWVEITANVRYYHITDIKYRRGGYIDIYAGPFIRSLTLSLDNSDAVLPVRINSVDGALLEDNDQKVRYFLNEIMELIRLDGFAKVYIEGNGDPGTIIDIDFVVNLQAYVIY